jgi:hypothetical protein
MTRAAPLPHLQAVAEAMAQPGQPDAAMAALDAAMGATIGHKLFTILIVDKKAGYNQRYYSNMPEHYLIGGRKPINKTGWFAQVVDDGKPWIGNDYAAIQWAFFDHELIKSLGCESCLNVPVRIDGETIGTLNLLHEAGWYTEADAELGKVFGALAVPAMQQIIARG